MLSKIYLSVLRRSLVGSLETPNNAAPVTQLVRWRKRRWAPKNPSKIFYFPQRHIQDPEEKAELQVLYKQYRTAFKALQLHFKKEVAKKQAISTSKDQTEKDQAEWDELMKINDAWNVETAKIREARQGKTEIASDEERLGILAKLEEEQLIKQMEAQKIVQQEIEESKYFIDQDNLDVEIEKALNMRVSYNFAVDTEGNRYIETADGSTEADSTEAPTTRRFPEKAESGHL